MDKRLLFLIMCFLGLPICAQTTRLHFIYIDHETTTPTNNLCKKIQDLRDKAIENGGGLIVYLANGFSPMVSATNVESIDEKYVGDEAFDDIIAALQEENSHDVNAKTDLNQILQLAEQCHINDDKMKLGYKRVTFDFYVGSTFWGLRNEERLLSYLYFALEVPKLMEEDFSFNIYKPKDDKLEHLENKPFGEKNVERINNFRIMDI